MADFFESETPITLFRGDFWFLSALSPARLTLDGLTFATAEAAYHSLKTDDPNQRALLASISDGVAAKRAGRAVDCRTNWHDVRVDAMRRVTALKFADRALATKLIATAPRRLVHGNSHADQFWGVVPNGNGKNMLGFLLMERRDALIADPRTR